MATKIVTKNSSTASAVPTASDLVQGELAVNVADKRLFTEDNGGAIVELGVNPAAEITANAGIALPDSQKATFGASDDLQIYHDGSDSFVSDVGTGDLYLQGSSNIYFRKGNGGEVFAHFADDGACKLRFDNSTKLATTSTGIDVTGTATMDGLTVDGGNTIRLNAASGDDFLTISQGTADANITANSAAGNANLVLSTTASGTTRERLDISFNGDISFYEDTGTTPKLFWDASAESLGIGTSSPNEALHVYNATTNVLANFESGDSKAFISFKDNSTTNTDTVFLGAEGNNMAFYAGSASSERMRIDSSGNVGIGTSSPSNYYSTTLVVDAPDEDGITVVSPTTGTGYLMFADGTSGNAKYRGYINYAHAVDEMQFATSGLTRARIDSSGNLMVGTTSTDPAASSTETGVALKSGGFVSISRNDSAASVNINKIGFNGSLVDFRKDGTTVGSIGSHAGIYTYIGTDDTALLFAGNIDAVMPFSPSASNYRDNAIDLGTSSYRFDDIYATNGTIQTSDRNEKQDIAELSDAEQRVAVACKGLLRKFRWKDSVAEKGDEARTHFGIMAQDLQAAFVAEGLDAGDYAMFISTTWTDEETNEEKTRMGVRYSELLAFIISAI